MPSLAAVKINHHKKYTASQPIFRRFWSAYAYAKVPRSLQNKITAWLKKALVSGSNSNKQLIAGSLESADSVRHRDAFEGDLGCEHINKELTPRHTTLFLPMSINSIIPRSLEYVVFTMVWP